MEYEKVSSKYRTRGVLIYFLSAFGFGVICLIILLNVPFFKTPLELSLERELSQYKSQFDILNDKMTQLESVIANIEDRDNSIYRVFFEMSPIPDDQRREGFGGVNRYKQLEGFSNSEIIIETTKRIELLQKRTVVESKSLDEILNLASNKEAFLRSIPAIQPVDKEYMRRIASGFGMRIDPFTKVRKMHKGMDFALPIGSPIYATGDGVVERCDNRSPGYGNHIRIKHAGGYTTLYAHLKSFKVKKGQRVKRGEVIGFAGITGRTEGPHLHYEVIKDKQRINPINFYYGSLSSDELRDILEQSEKENQSFD